MGFKMVDIITCMMAHKYKEGCELVMHSLGWLGEGLLCFWHYIGAFQWRAQVLEILISVLLSFKSSKHSTKSIIWQISKEPRLEIGETCAEITLSGTHCSAIWI